MNTFEVLMLALFLGICLGVGAVGGFFTSSSVKTWFPTLCKPSWNPPSWLFAPVWTTLYIMMAIAGWAVWRDGRFMSVAGGLYVLQLILNFAWSWLFFGLKRPDLALIEVIMLWASILATLTAFWQINPLAGWLFVPYLAWVTFASFLNHAIWKLNPKVKRLGTDGRRTH
jgi:tryptophan-rich sensory protein